MSDMMKKMGKGGMLKQAMRSMFGKSGMHSILPADMGKSQIDAKALQSAAKEFNVKGGLPGGISGLGPDIGLPSGLSGFGKKK